MIPFFHFFLAPLVAEVANGGTPPAADDILADRGITVIPDIICTAGGTVLGYFEWVQDMQAFFWTDAEITAQLDRIVAKHNFMRRIAVPAANTVCWWSIWDICASANWGVSSSSSIAILRSAVSSPA